ncbi:MAG: sodium:calcium antiporter [Candidatus Eremiobacteraeota bacterium]|nr:sodium:calcium antiporter [Candidatus Eremiobacteraeota bacterium]
MKRWLALILLPLVPLPWIVMRIAGIHLDPVSATLLSGFSIFAAAFLLSWAAEVAQLDIPPSMAIAVLALIAVLPEYAVDMVFAWKAGKDPVYAHYAVANMTGSNRLIIGVAWALVVILFWWKSGKKCVRLESPYLSALVVLLMATVYSFLIPWKRSISIIDGAVLFSFFLVYLYLAMKEKVQEPELEGPPATIAMAPKLWRRVITALIFLYSALAIYVSAEPFAEGLIHIGKTYGIEEFLLVQWLAPLASESPEFIVAAIFALKGSPSASIGTLVSSKVNQWTLLVGLLPVVFCISSARIHPLMLDARQVEEVFLTSAQSLFAVSILMDRRISLFEAGSLFSLFIAQLLLNTTESRHIFSYIYLVLAVLVVFKQLRCGGYKWVPALFRIWRKRAKQSDNCSEC